MIQELGKDTQMGVLDFRGRISNREGEKNLLLNEKERRRKKQWERASLSLAGEVVAGWGSGYNWAPRKCPGLGCSLSSGLRPEFEGSPRLRKTQNSARRARPERSQFNTWGDPSPAVWAWGERCGGTTASQPT